MTGANSIVVFIGMHAIQAALIIVAAARAKKGHFPTGWMVAASLWMIMENGGSVLQYRAQGGHDWPIVLFVGIGTDVLLMLIGILSCLINRQKAARLNEESERLHDGQGADGTLLQDSLQPLQRAEAMPFGDQGSVKKDRRNNAAVLNVLRIVLIVFLCGMPVLYLRASYEMTEAAAIKTAQLWLDYIFKGRYEEYANWEGMPIEEAETDLEKYYDEMISSLDTSGDLQSTGDFSKEDLTEIIYGIGQGVKYEVTSAEKLEEGFRVKVKTPKMIFRVEGELLQAQAKAIMDSYRKQENIEITYIERQKILSAARAGAVKEALKAPEYGDISETDIHIVESASGIFCVDESAKENFLEEFSEYEWDFPDEQENEEMTEWFLGDYRDLIEEYGIYANSPYKGTWNAISAEYNGVSLDQEEMGGAYMMLLEPDGTATMDDGIEATSGNWEEVEGGIRLDDDDDLTLLKAEDNLILEMDGVSFTFARQEE